MIVNELYVYVYVSQHFTNYFLLYCVRNAMLKEEIKVPAYNVASIN